MGVEGWGSVSTEIPDSSTIPKLKRSIETLGGGGEESRGGGGRRERATSGEGCKYRDPGVIHKT